MNECLIRNKYLNEINTRVAERDACIEANKRPRGLKGPHMNKLRSKEAREFSFIHGLKFLKALPSERRGACDAIMLHKYLVEIAKELKIEDGVIKYITINSLIKTVRPKLKKALKKIGGWQKHALIGSKRKKR